MNNFYKYHEQNTLPAIEQFGKEKSIDLMSTDWNELIYEMRDDGIIGDGLNEIYEALGNKAFTQVFGLLEYLKQVS